MTKREWMHMAGAISFGYGTAAFDAVRAFNGDPWIWAARALVFGLSSAALGWFVFLGNKVSD